MRDEGDLRELFTGTPFHDEIIYFMCECSAHISDIPLSESFVGGGEEEETLRVEDHHVVLDESHIESITLEPMHEDEEMKCLSIEGSSINRRRVIEHEGLGEDNWVDHLIAEYPDILHGVV